MKELLHIEASAQDYSSQEPATQVVNTETTKVRQQQSPMPPQQKEQTVPSSTFLLGRIEALLASEASARRPGKRGTTQFSSRIAARLIHKSWPAWKGDICFFANEGCFFSKFPTDFLLDLLGFLPHLQVQRLSLVCLAFAMPQPSLNHAQTIPHTAINFYGAPLMSVSEQDPVNLWLRSAPASAPVRCLVVREQRMFGIGRSEFSLYVQDSVRGNEMLLLVAIKRGGSFSIYNVGKGHAGSGRLRRHGGNYIGCLKSNALRVDHVMLSADGKAEYGAISFRREGLGRSNPWIEGPQPRRAHIVLPVIDKDGMPFAVEAAGANAVGLMQPLRQVIRTETDDSAAIPPHCFPLRTKEPVFDPYSGSYRLNFHGRVTVPSIKNLQVIHDDEPNVPLCQFGKVDEHRFHLDFRRPFNAFQALCVALASFSHY